MLDTPAFRTFFVVAYDLAFESTCELTTEKAHDVMSGESIHGVIEKSRKELLEAAKRHVL